MLIRHEWMETFMVRVHRGGRDDLLKDNLKRELTLRDERVGSKLLYHVTYSEQLASGRHAKSVITESFPSYETALAFLLTQAQKYAPQNVIDEIQAKLNDV
jgi:hypothetical protein